MTTLHAQPDSTLSQASARLTQNRVLLAGWLDQERAALADPARTHWAAQVAGPLIDLMSRNPAVTSLALGALTQSWRRPSPTQHDPQPKSQALPRVTTLVRQHPKTATLVLAALVSATWWWSRSQPTPSRSVAASPPHRDDG